ncbi:MAG: transaldolase [SAR202 cluster bacterium Io17-Chloro-G3]|nr:MAG: transaldolase [SAR202 cluster bacterium Io17-Chloro-G3]
MTNPIQQAQKLGQAVWYDNISRGLLESGGLKHLVDMGITGLTSNPTIFEKAVASGSEYDEVLTSLARTEAGVKETYESIALEDIASAAELLRPVYDRTQGVDGYACLEVSPELAHNTDGTVAEARKLFKQLNRPNAMIKVPATLEGIPAIRKLIGEGININVTLIFALETYFEVAGAYIAGLEDLARMGGSLSRVASVASFFVSRVDTVVDARLEESIDQGHEELRSLLGRAANDNAKLAYQAFKEAFSHQRFEVLRSAGARVQRPLWASTGTKNPAYSDLHYVEPLIGRDTVNTMPPLTLTAFLDHGIVKPTLELGVAAAKQTVETLGKAGINLVHVTDKLLIDGERSFSDSFNSLLANIAKKKVGI